MNEAVEVALASAHEQYWSRVTGTLAREMRDLDLAEEAAQDAFVTALEAWQRSGIPEHQLAWLLTVARRKALDRIRREATLARKLPQLIVPDDDDFATDDPDHFPDDQLRLLFTCCHPAIAPEARVALALRMVCGLETATVARLFIVPLPTMAARITRAKKKIASAGIAYRVPRPDELPSRLPAVLSTIYLLFTAGHTAPAGPNLVSPELVRRSLALARLLSALMPDEPEVLGLFALLRLSDARRETRVDGRGRLLLLEDQDRSRWDRVAIGEGVATLERSLGLTRGRLPGRYVLQAAIEAVHLDAPSYDETDWPQLLALYVLLREVAPSPLVDLNQAVVLAKVAGPEAGLAALDGLADWRGGEQYYLYAAARADVLRLLGRTQDALGEYRRARSLTSNEAERAFLETRIAENAE